MLEFPLQALVAAFSLLAGGFWMASAYGRTVTPIWKQSKVVATVDLPAHQSLWNARAALCASIAAICQAFAFPAAHSAKIFASPLF